MSQFEVRLAVVLSTAQTQNKTNTMASAIIGRGLRETGAALKHASGLEVCNIGLYFIILQLVV